MNRHELWKLINFYARFTPDYTRIGHYARRLFWPADAPADFSGQRWLVTGASTGLGQAIMTMALEQGARVLAVASNSGRLEAAIDALGRPLRDRVTPLQCDLASLVATRALLQRVLAADDRLDVLVNNAGILNRDLRLSPEGLESSFVINVLSHFVLTEGLIAGNGLSPGAAVLNMTSGGMYNVPLGIAGLNVTDAGAYNGKVSYAFAKRAQVSLSSYWNRVYGPSGLRFYVTHPGWARTPGVQEALPTFYKLQRLILRSPREGADTAMWLLKTRPPVGTEEQVWFDRKPRDAHMYELTRKAQCTPDQLVEFLREQSSQ